MLNGGSGRRHFGAHLPAGHTSHKKNTQNKSFSSNRPSNGKKINPILIPNPPYMNLFLLHIVWGSKNLKIILMLSKKCPKRALSKVKAKFWDFFTGASAT